jgi:TetR/AcrR family transcriptional regulator, tetracycline repressor protein
MADKTERRPLSRELVVASAIRFVDEHSLTALSMRRLGASLGVEAMSLYRYVNGREDLLEAMVDWMVSQLELDSDKQFGPLDGWQAYLQWLAHGVRKLAQEHPLLFPLIATRHPAAPWLRPPLRSLQVVEDFLNALTSRGFGHAAAVNAYRAFSSFLLGHLLLEASTLGAQTAPVEEPLDEGTAHVPNEDGQLELSDFPLVQKFQPELSQDRSDEEFEKSLEGLLDRLELEMTE